MLYSIPSLSTIISQRLQKFLAKESELQFKKKLGKENHGIN